MAIERIEQKRKDWAASDSKRDAGLVTPEDIRRYDDISYGPYGEWNLLDIYQKNNVTAPQPTIINVHGGGWFYGTKEIYQFYCMNLAQRGFTVVSFNYRLAPENLYPAPLEDINAAMTFVKEHCDEYYIDINNLFMVGDSAGAQLASQYLTILTSPAYAKFFDLQLPDITVRAAGLNCGLYDMRKRVEAGLGEEIEDYVGGRDALEGDYRGVPVWETMDILKYMTKDFPASYVMTAYNDFLVAYAEPMYEQLQKLGVDSKMKIYGSKEQEEIAHVFHVNIRLEEARKCNDDECEFFRQHMTVNGV